MTRHDHCVIAHSVYNAVSFSGRDMRFREVSDFLRAAWDPAMSRNAARISPQTVAAGAEFLRRRNLVEVAGDMIRIPIRDVRTRRGRPVVKTADRTDLR